MICSHARILRCRFVRKFVRAIAQPWRAPSLAADRAISCRERLAGEFLAALWQNRQADQIYFHRAARSSARDNGIAFAGGHRDPSPGCVRLPKDKSKHPSMLAESPNA